MLEKGTLYVCATPIGNLADITLRVLDTLRQVDLIAAEDTRHSRKLLQHYGIKASLTSYHEHNEKGKANELLLKLKAGQTIALVSDAGMPGISDPGQEIIRRCQEENVPVDVLPGANAALTALILSGMPANQFAFQGFLPATTGQRKNRLVEYAPLPLTQIFYEAPHRLLATLEDMFDVFGDRKAAVVREVTKLHQTAHRGTISQLVREFQANSPKGECCIIVAPFVHVQEKGDPEDWCEDVEQRLEIGQSPAEAMKEVARKYGISKRDVYQAIINKKEGR